MIPDYEESSEERGWGAPYLPTSPFEVLLVTAASVVSIIVISYTGIMLYRCVCSRHYADWRTKSWWSRTREQVICIKNIPMVTLDFVAYQ